MVDRTRFIVFGKPSDELKVLLDGFGATYFEAFGRYPILVVDLYQYGSPTLVARGGQHAACPAKSAPGPKPSCDQHRSMSDIEG